MKYGFFHGTEGDLPSLRAALELLADCDRVVSLGDLVGRPSPGDAGCLALAIDALRTGTPLFLAGLGERQRSHDLTLPANVRALLRELAPATVERGVAILGGCAAAPVGGPVEARAVGDRPRLVAPLTVAASGRGPRIWRAERGGLGRVEALGDAVPLVTIPDERVRIDVGRVSAEDGTVTCVVLDLAKKQVERRERLLLVQRARTPGRARLG